jgi:signal transduction histidine kinase
MPTTSQPLWRKSGAGILIVALFALAFACTMTSLRWINAPFPGFFVLSNRVVASVALPHWRVGPHRHVIYQSEVIAVNDQSVAAVEEILAFVRQLPAGSPVVYTLRKDGRSFQLTLPTSVFTIKDYTLIFAAYLFTALTIACTSLVVWVLKPANPASLALLVAGLVTGVFGVTALDLYSPYRFFRLHALAEAFLPAGYVHLAFVFPVDRFRRSRLLLISLPYVISGALAIAYELFLYRPATYSFVHNLSMLYVGVATPVFLGRFVWDYVATQSPLVRQRIRIIIVGFVSGYGLPTLLMFLSGITGGEIPVNYMAFSAFLFPASIGYAIAKHNLFEIDAFLKRWLSYLLLTLALTLTYFLLLAFLNFTLHASQLAQSPLFPLLFALGVVFFLHPLKDFLQTGIDRVFFHLHYNPKKVLEETSAFLASTLRLEEILAFIWRTVEETVGVAQGQILLRASEKEPYVPVYPLGQNGSAVAALQPLLEEWRGKECSLSSYDAVNGGVFIPFQDQTPTEPDSFDVQLFVPFLFKGKLLGGIALGEKNNGTFFSADDVTFLATLANQGALSIANALAYQEIQQLNADLEKKVEQVREQEQEVERSHTQLRRLSARLLHLQEEERERISRELHDHLGQMLTATRMDIRWAQHHCPPELAPIRERLQEASYLVQATIRATRELSLSLRPEIVTENGLEVALKQSVEEFERRSGLPVRFSCSLNKKEIPPQTAMNVYRIVQEALSNIARHATAKHVEIQVQSTTQTLTASIVDDGVGFNGSTLSDPYALGLVGMQERARLLGGQVEIRSAPGMGVAVYLEIPFNGEGSEP